jgi:hypothetical protein
LKGDRQQHGDGRRGPDARQNADQRAKDDPDQAEQQVLGDAAVAKPSDKFDKRSIVSAP